MKANLSATARRGRKLWQGGSSSRPAAWVTRSGAVTMCPSGRFQGVLPAVVALVAATLLLWLAPAPTFGAERSEGSQAPSGRPGVGELVGPEIPLPIRELCEAMELQDYARWYGLLSDESREGRTEEEFVRTHEGLVEHMIGGLEQRYGLSFMLRTHVTVKKYPNHYIGRFQLICYSPHSFEQERVLYETGVDIAFEMEPDGRVTTKFGGYGNTGWETTVRVLPPGSM